MDSRHVLWTPNHPWVDFMPLLYGEAVGPVTFISQNRSAYVINPGESWWRRETVLEFNRWSYDGVRLPLLQVLCATSCGLVLWYAADYEDFAATTPIVLVVAGELLADAIDVTNVSRPSGHPLTRCHAPYCERRRMRHPL